MYKGVQAKDVPDLAMECSLRVVTFVILLSLVWGCEQVPADGHEGKEQQVEDDAFRGDDHFFTSISFQRPVPRCLRAIEVRRFVIVFCTRTRGPSTATTTTRRSCQRCPVHSASRLSLD